jgi:hypothetical protein
MPTRLILGGDWPELTTKQQSKPAADSAPRYSRLGFWRSVRSRRSECGEAPTLSDRTVRIPILRLAIRVGGDLWSGLVNDSLTFPHCFASSRNDRPYVNVLVNNDRFRCETRWTAYHRILLAAGSTIKSKRHYITSLLQSGFAKLDCTYLPGDFSATLRRNLFDGINGKKSSLSTRKRSLYK